MRWITASSELLKVARPNMLKSGWTVSSPLQREDGTWAVLTNCPFPIAAFIW